MQRLSISGAHFARKPRSVGPWARLIHLWAGTGHRQAKAEHVTETFARLAGRL
ncbi:hypothetical protein [Streptomyces eurythermus]